MASAAWHPFSRPCLSFALALVAAGCGGSSAPSWSRFHGTNEPVGYAPAGLAVNATDWPIVMLGGGEPEEDFVQRWTGSDWQPLDARGVAPVSISGVALALDRAGRPVVLVQGYVLPTPIEPGRELGVYVIRWTGDAWEIVGGGTIDGDSGAAIALALDSEDRPLALVGTRHPGSQSFDDYRIVRWDGSSWQQLGSAPNPVPGSQLVPEFIAVDPAGFPVVELLENDGAQVNAYVVRWDGGTWKLVGGAIRPAAGFDVMRAPTPLNSHLVLDSSGAPTVAFQTRFQAPEASLGDGYVFRWTGNAWQMLGGPFPPGPPGSGVVALAVDRTDLPVIAVQDGSRGHLFRWVNGSWGAVGSEVDSGVDQSCDLLGMTIDSRNLPVVMFWQAGSVTNSLEVARLAR